MDIKDEGEEIEEQVQEEEEEEEEEEEVEQFNGDSLDGNTNEIEDNASLLSIDEEDDDDPRIDNLLDATIQENNHVLKINKSQNNNDWIAETVIMDCFQWTMEQYNKIHPETWISPNEQDAEPQTNEPQQQQQQQSMDNSSWKPKSLDLPLWAISESKPN